MQAKSRQIFTKNDLNLRNVSSVLKWTYSVLRTNLENFLKRYLNCDLRGEGSISVWQIHLVLLTVICIYVFSALFNESIEMTSDIFLILGVRVWMAHEEGTDTVHSVRSLSEYASVAPTKSTKHLCHSLHRKYCILQIEYNVCF
jgi:hypothetical protein